MDKKNISYVKDPIEVETVQAPEITLKIRAGDCDDHAVLMASFAANIGIDSKFSVIGNDLDSFSHVFPELFINHQWTATDTTSAIPFGESHRLNIKKSFLNKGVEQMPTFQNVMANNNNRSKLKSIAFNQTKNLTLGLLHSGRMNLQDLQDAINQAKATPIVPGSMTELLPDVIQALEIIKSQIPKQPLTIPRYKNIQVTNRLAGINGFFGDIWNGVKDNIGNVVKKVIGGGQQQTAVTTQQQQQQRQQLVSSENGSSGLFNNPLILIGGAVLFFFMMKGR